MIDANQRIACLAKSSPTRTSSLVTYTGIGSPIRRMFEMDVMFFGRAMLILNVAFSAGSSKHGKARRASVGWNCDAAIHLQHKVQETLTIK